MTLTELASALHAKKHHGYYMASCPVHGRGGKDRMASLSIRDGKKGLRLHCFAGCDTRDVLRELGLTFRDLGYSSPPVWRERLTPPPKRTVTALKPLGKLEATYRYTDEHGSLVAEKLRFPGKVFLWRTQKSGGGWSWKVNRDSLPLYNLRDVVAAPTVILVEGEKDADNLKRHVRGYGMFAVTTAPNGAKSWRPDFVPWFIGKMVWIFPDSDEPGMRYAAVAAQAIHKVAKQVRVVPLTPAKDVSDYLLSHSPHDLAALMRLAPLWRPK